MPPEEAAMDPEITIRPLKPEDTEAAAAIAVAAWKPIFAHFRSVLGDEMYDICYPDGYEVIKAAQVRGACRGEGGALVAVAEVGGQVVAFISYYPHRTASTAEIGNNAVHPDWQGRGIGPRMYEFVFDQLRTMSVRVVRVRTGGDPAHAPARRAYEKAGFQVSLPEVTYYREL